MQSDITERKYGDGLRVLNITDDRWTAAFNLNPFRGSFLWSIPDHVVKADVAAELFRDAIPDHPVSLGREVPPVEHFVFGWVRSQYINGGGIRSTRLHLAATSVDMIERAYRALLLVKESDRGSADGVGRGSLCGLG